MDVQYINILLKRSNINYWTYDQTLTFEVRLDKFRGLNFYG